MINLFISSFRLSANVFFKNHNGELHTPTPDSFLDGITRREVIKIAKSKNIKVMERKIKPDEIYNLAAQSHVSVSFEVPEYTANADAIGALRILEAIKFHGFEKITKFYQAGTSEMFGKVMEVTQTEKTPFYPRSPYGVAKVYAHFITINYREAYNIFACNGILFNHESPVRGETFVTRKIVIGLCKIKLKKMKTLRLGNLNAKRDWGHAKDYVEAMWKMLQRKTPWCSYALPIS